MGAIASQITSLTIVYSTIYSDADQRKHQSSTSLAFLRGIHRGPVNTTHKWPITRKMFPFDDVIMIPGKLLAIGWMAQDLTDDQSIVVHVKAWCRQAATHGLRQRVPPDHNELKASTSINNALVLDIWYIEQTKMVGWDRHTRCCDVYAYTLNCLFSSCVKAD